MVPPLPPPGDPPLYWPERRYQWGTAEAFNKEHSDLLSLRSLLLKEALEEITRTKRQRYEDWRRRQLGGFRLGLKIRRMLMFTIVPAIVCLQVRSWRIHSLIRRPGGNQFLTPTSPSPLQFRRRVNCCGFSHQPPLFELPFPFFLSFHSRECPLFIFPSRYSPLRSLAAAGCAWVTSEAGQGRSWIGCALGRGGCASPCPSGSEQRRRLRRPWRPRLLPLQSRPPRSPK